MANSVLTAAQLANLPADVQVVDNVSTDGILDNTMGFVSSLFKGEGVNNSELLWGTLISVSAAFIGGSYVGRNRALAGKEPIMGIIG